ncbi:MAG: ABC transporter ATP-binding protein [Rubrobacter sp.]|nr:ABC transporter ATP-binding protein [Rubrobacter sp.]
MGMEDDHDQSLVATSPPVPIREIFRRFWPYARPYRRWIWVSLIFIALAPATETAMIWMFKIVIDEVLVPGDLGPLRWIVLAMLGLALFAGVLSFCDNYLSVWVGERFLLSLRTSFFRHLQGLSLDFFERRRLGDIISRLSGDIAAIENFVLSGIVDVLSNVLRIIFFGGALFYLQWRLTLVSLIVAPLFWLATRYFSRLIKQVSREKRRRSGSITAVAEESLSNIALVQAYNRQETEVDRFHRENLGSFKATMTSTRLKALFGPLVQLIQLAGALVVISMGAWELSQGRLSLGGLLAFLTYLSQLYSPIRGLSSMVNSIYSSSAAAERLIEFWDQRPSITEREDAVSLARAHGVVGFENVSFRYPETTREALDSISFSVGPGETLALVGPSGAGKSTIAKLLLRFYDPTAGQVLVDGHDLRDLQLHSLRENVALLLQETLVFDGTIRENIAYGRPEATFEEIVSAAKAADAHGFITSLPEGYETSVGQKGRRLSGGQRQRLAIARAMVRDAPILILDEPTTGLDAESGWRVLEPLRRLMSGRTTIVISHNLMTVREATSIVVLNDGCIIEHGTHQQLVTRGGTYSRLYHAHYPDAEEVPALTADPTGMKAGGR